MMTARWALLLAGISLLVGSAGAFFLLALGRITSSFDANPWLIYLLPLFGLAMTWAYRHFTPPHLKGIKTLVAEIREPKERLPASMGPMIIATTLLSHLGGGSVGREGTALQLGGAFADQLHNPRLFLLTPQERRVVLLCGVSAGFAAVFGTPWAGAVFALEFVAIGGLRWTAAIPCLVAALGAEWVGGLWHVHHSDYHFAMTAAMTPVGFLWAGAIGLACGLAAKGYLLLTLHNPWPERLLPNPYTRIFVGSLAFVAIVNLTGLGWATSLGLDSIAAAFSQPSSLSTSALKLLLTGLCVACGLRGGEVTPLFFVGATLGSALSTVSGLPLPVSAGIGFVSVFAGAGAVPLACVVMACEIFNPHIAAYALTACLASRLLVGKHGLYSE